MPESVSSLLGQLQVPENQLLLSRWLHSGAGSKALAALIQQLKNPDSPLQQWLSTLPHEQGEEIQALLRLVSEQRHAENPKAPDNQTLTLQLMYSEKASIELKVGPEHQGQHVEKVEGKEQWKISLKLPIGDTDHLRATALWSKQGVELAFVCANPALLKKVETASPLLTSRLEQLGIRQLSTEFVCQQETAQPQEGQGLSIKV